MTEPKKGNGHDNDVRAEDIELYEKIEKENPTSEEQRWFTENFGTGERDIKHETPEALDESKDEPLEG